MHRLAVWVQEVVVPTLGPPGMFLVAFLDSSFISIPELNDLLVVGSATAHPSAAWLYVTMATLGSVAGCCLLWWLGGRGGEAVLSRRFGSERVDRVRAAFRRWDVLALAVPALLPPPMPFKIFVLSAGVFGFSFRRFLLTLLVARGLRYAFWAAMGLFYGDHALALLMAADGWFAANAPLLLAAAGTALVVALAVAALRRRSRVSPGVGGLS